MLGVIVQHKDKWIFSVQKGSAGGGHVFASEQAIKYLDAKGEETAMLYFSMRRESVRFNVEAAGPKTKFMLDPDENAERLGEARRVLKELGVPEDRIGLAEDMVAKE
jgi:hypothetical protein